MNHSRMWFSKEKSLKIEQVKSSHHCWASDIDNGMINLNANIHVIGVLLYNYNSLSMFVWTCWEKSKPGEVE